MDKSKPDGSNVVNLFKTEEPISADEVLELSKGRFQDIMILGYDKEGRMSFTASEDLTWAEVTFAMQVFLNGVYSGEYYDDNQ